MACGSAAHVSTMADPKACASTVTPAARARSTISGPQRSSGRENPTTGADELVIEPLRPSASKPTSPASHMKR
jgi:hypothetical protein